MARFLSLSLGHERTWKFLRQSLMAGSEFSFSRKVVLDARLGHTNLSGMFALLFRAVGIHAGDIGSESNAAADESNGNKTERENEGRVHDAILGLTTRIACQTRLKKASAHLLEVEATKGTDWTSSAKNVCEAPACGPVCGPPE